MENQIEVPVPQNPQETIVPMPATPPVLTEAEIADLKHKAEVSSQNFERAKKAELELKALKENTINEVPSEQDAWSDEGKILQTKISSVESELQTIKEERDLERLYNQYPLLREKADEFIEFRKSEHPRAKIESVAKLYLAEEGLLEPKRKGLENPTGGSRTPQTFGTMTSEEAKHLRETNFRKYQDMLKKDQIKIV